MAHKRRGPDSPSRGRADRVSPILGTKARPQPGIRRYNGLREAADRGRKRCLSARLPMRCNLSQTALDSFLSIRRDRGRSPAGVHPSVRRITSPVNSRRPSRTRSRPYREESMNRPTLRLGGRRAAVGFTMVEALVITAADRRVDHYRHPRHPAYPRDRAQKAGCSQQPPADLPGRPVVAGRPTPPERRQRRAPGRRLAGRVGAVRRQHPRLRLPRHDVRQLAGRPGAGRARHRPDPDHAARQRPAGLDLRAGLPDLPERPGGDRRHRRPPAARRPITASRSTSRRSTARPTRSSAWIT